MSATTTTDSSAAQLTTAAAATLLGGELETGDPSAIGHSREDLEFPVPNVGNPSWWPTDHRRIPQYRPARFHPDWSGLTATRRESLTIVCLFVGCHLLSVSTATCHCKVDSREKLTRSRSSIGSLENLVSVTASSLIVLPVNGDLGSTSTGRDRRKKLIQWTSSVYS